MAGGLKHLDDDHYYDACRLQRRHGLAERATMADDPAVCTRFKNCSSDVLNARGCEDVYNNELPKGWCHCLRPEDNVTGNLAQLRRQQPVARMHTPTDGAPSASGGLAIILRGGAFRGSRDDDANTRHTAQMEASRSLYRHAIKPFIALGQRVRVYLTLYSDVDSSLLRDLYSPYKRHVAGITRLHVNASQQLTMNANALGTFLQLVEAQQERFDVVVMTRFDLYFKMDFPKLLGTPDLRNFSGVSILWRELEEGSKWRILWTPTKLGRIGVDGDRGPCAHATHRGQDGAHAQQHNDAAALDGWHSHRRHLPRDWLPVCALLSNGGAAGDDTRLDEPL